LSTGLTCGRTDPALLDVATVAPAAVLGLEVPIVARLIRVEHGITTTFCRWLVFDVDAVTVSITQADISIAVSITVAVSVTLARTRRTRERHDNESAK
jgi:hypothetical protein